MAPPPAPFLCINYWQAVCRHRVDMPHPVRHLYEYREAFDPRAVATGDRVFVLTDLLDAFVSRALPLVRQPFELVTGDSYAVPSEAAVSAIQACALVTRWYAVNSLVGSNKIVALPLGVEAPCILDHDVLVRAGEVPPGGAREIDVLATRCFDDVPGAFKHPRLTRRGTMRAAKYTLCPRLSPDGPDLHSVYHCLAIGTVPIYVARGGVPAAYARLPVVVATDLPHLRSILDDLDDWEPWRARIDWAGVTALLRDPSTWLH